MKSSILSPIGSTATSCGLIRAYQEEKDAL
jgi:hypothetical protein